MTRRHAVVCGCCLLGALLVVRSAAAQSEPSLAEVARREAERRAKIKSEAKTYTNEDLRKGPGLTTGTQAPKPATPARTATPQTPPPAPDPAKEEKHWRDRITAARASLERNQVFLDALQSRINALTADFTARDDPAQRALIGIERQRALVEMDRVKAEIQQITQQIAEIEEEARRAGVPPGWLR